MAIVDQTVTYSVSNNGTPAGTYGSWSVAPGTAGIDWNMIPVSNSGLNSIQVKWLTTTFSPYTVAVTATNSCSNLLASKQETVTSGAGSPILVVTPNCNAFTGAATFTVTISGGTAPYTAIINGGSSQSVSGNTITLTGISGSNSITVTDNLGFSSNNTANYSCERYHIGTNCAFGVQSFFTYLGLTPGSVYQLDCNQCYTVDGSVYTDNPVGGFVASAAVLKTNCVNCIVFDYTVTGSCSGVNLANVSGTIVGLGIAGNNYDYSYESDLTSPATAYQPLVTTCGNFSINNLSIDSGVLILYIRDSVGTVIARTVALNC